MDPYFELIPPWISGRILVNSLLGHTRIWTLFYGVGSRAGIRRYPPESTSDFRPNTRGFTVWNTMDLDPGFEHYPWNPVFDPWSRTPDLGYMLRYGLIPLVDYTGSLVQHPILPTPVLGISPEQVYTSTDEIRRAQREQHARARCARPRARIMRAHYDPPGTQSLATVGTGTPG